MEFIKRNFPIVALLIITVVVFVGIIFASRDAEPERPSLEVSEETALEASHSYSLGKQDAIVTMVVFSDFQCPACKQASPILKTLVRKYDGDLRVVYRHFPLPQHQYAKLAAEAAQIAGEQGMFWEYHDVLFANQDRLDKDSLIDYAGDLGLDKNKFKEDLDGDFYATIVAEDLRDARGLGIANTPTFYINSKKVSLTSFNQLDQLVAEEIASIRGIDETQEGEDTEENPLLGQPSVTPVQKELTTEEIDEEKGFVEIEFTEEGGFEPIQPAVMVGQKVIWKNNTARPIEIKQNVKSFDEFAVPITIEAGGTFEFRPYKDNIWIYEEVESEKRGGLLINEPVELELEINL